MPSQVYSKLQRLGASSDGSSGQRLHCDHPVIQTARILHSQGFLQIPRSKPWLLQFLHCLTPFVPTPASPAPASRGRHLPPLAARPRPKLSQPSADPSPSTVGGRGRPGQGTAPARAPSPPERRGRGTARVGPAPSRQRPGRPRRHERPEAAVLPPQEAAGRARHLPAHSAGRARREAAPPPPPGKAPRDPHTGRRRLPAWEAALAVPHRPPEPAGGAEPLGGHRHRSSRSRPAATPARPPVTLAMASGSGRLRPARLAAAPSAPASWAGRGGTPELAPRWLPAACSKCSGARPAGEGRGGPALGFTYPPRKHIPPRCRQAGWGGICGAAGRDGRAVLEAGLGSRFPPASMCAARQRLIWRGLAAEWPLGPALQSPGRAGHGAGAAPRPPRSRRCPKAGFGPSPFPELFSCSPPCLERQRGSGQGGIARPCGWPLFPKAVEVTKRLMDVSLSDEWACLVLTHAPSWRVAFPNPSAGACWCSEHALGILKCPLK